MISRRAKDLALVSTLVALALPVLAHGAAMDSLRVTALDRDRSLEASQSAIGRAIGDYRFIDAKGGTVSLADLKGKPLVVSLIYTGCSDICPMVTQRLRDAVEEAQRVIGSDRFAVISVGFDTAHDTPMRMAAFARAQGVNRPNWRFLSGSEAEVAGLARDIGFSYAGSAGGFLHTAQTTIVDRDGRVYRQVYSDDFPIQMFMEPLKETVYGTVGSFLDMKGLLDRVRFICTVYDPNQGRYRVSYAIVMSLLTGIISLGTAGLFISRAWLNSRRA